MVASMISKASVTTCSGDDEEESLLLLVDDDEESQVPSKSGNGGSSRPTSTVSGWGYENSLVSLSSVGGDSKNGGRASIKSGRKKGRRSSRAAASQASTTGSVKADRDSKTTQTWENPKLKKWKWAVIAQLALSGIGLPCCIFWWLNEAEFYKRAAVAVISALSYGFIALTLQFYDLVIGREMTHLLKKAARSRALVSSLYPSNVLDRLLDSNSVDGVTPADAQQALVGSNGRPSIRRANSQQSNCSGTKTRLRDQACSTRTLRTSHHQCNGGVRAPSSSTASCAIENPASPQADDATMTSACSSQASPRHYPYLYGTAAKKPPLAPRTVDESQSSFSASAAAATESMVKQSRAAPGNVDSSHHSKSEVSYGSLRNSRAAAGSANLAAGLNGGNPNNAHQNSATGFSFMVSQPPIADFFPKATILFADIAGFTAWSSTREPSHVFTLLEHVFHAFDTCAKKRGVFKVETVGDCYVAVSGLPEAREEHALVMAKFACDCMRKMSIVTQKLSRTKLGPDTHDLNVRMGLHSGAVTAGVLRGEKSRFQLFGDTMNTASRIETTGEAGRIHLSKETADLLAKAGKEHWLKLRTETVYAKGKGNIQTYWLKIARQSGGRRGTIPGTKSLFALPPSSSLVSRSSGDSDYYSDLTDDSDDENSSREGESQSAESWEDEELFNEGDTEDDLIDALLSPRTAGLINWNVCVLARLLKRVVLVNRHRQHVSMASDCSTSSKSRRRSSRKSLKATRLEAKEVLFFPPFDPNSPLVAMSEQELNMQVQLDPRVVEQLKDYVTNVAVSYGDSLFHSFERASHSVMMIEKLLGRMKYRRHRNSLPAASFGTAADFSIPEEENSQQDGVLSNGAAEYQRTYGLAHDPLALFACAFACLVRDCGHEDAGAASSFSLRLATNGQIKPDDVSEQSSLNLALDLFMDKSYRELRKTICPSEPELYRFRQLVANLVLATDLSRDMSDGSRWDFALFPSEKRKLTEAERDDTATSEGCNRNVLRNRRASLVVEHLVQASDVSHTMQHWLVYRKYDQYLFQSTCKDFAEGLISKHPRDFWYDGNLALFDTYIIPLAKRLDGCGVLGAAGEECLGYALHNRAEWSANGKRIVSEMAEEYGALSQKGNYLKNEDHASMASPTSASNTTSPSTVPINRRNYGSMGTSEQQLCGKVMQSTLRQMIRKTRNGTARRKDEDRMQSTDEYASCTGGQSTSCGSASAKAT